MPQKFTQDIGIQSPGNIREAAIPHDVAGDLTALGKAGKLFVDGMDDAALGKFSAEVLAVESANIKDESLSDLLIKGKGIQRQMLSAPDQETLVKLEGDLARVAAQLRQGVSSDSAAALARKNIYKNYITAHPRLATKITQQYKRLLGLVDDTGGEGANSKLGNKFADELELSPQEESWKEVAMIADRLQISQERAREIQKSRARNEQTDIEVKAKVRDGQANRATLDVGLDDRQQYQRQTFYSVGIEQLSRGMNAADFEIQLQDAIIAEKQDIRKYAAEMEASGNYIVPPDWVQARETEVDQTYARILSAAKTNDLKDVLEREVSILGNSTIMNMVKVMPGLAALTALAPREMVNLMTSSDGLSHQITRLMRGERGLVEREALYAPQQAIALAIEKYVKQNKGSVFELIYPFIGNAPGEPGTALPRYAPTEPGAPPPTSQQLLNNATGEAVAEEIRQGRKVGGPQTEHSVISTLVQQHNPGAFTAKEWLTVPRLQEHIKLYPKTQEAQKAQALIEIGAATASTSPVALSAIQFVPNNPSGGPFVNTYSPSLPRITEGATAPGFSGSVEAVRRQTYEHLNFVTQAMNDQYRIMERYMGPEKAQKEAMAMHDKFITKKTEGQVPSVVVRDNEVDLGAK